MKREDFETGKHFRSAKHGEGSKVFYKDGCSIWSYWPDEQKKLRLECSCYEFDENGFHADTYLLHKPILNFFKYSDFELVNQQS